MKTADELVDSLIAAWEQNCTPHLTGDAKHGLRAYWLDSLRTYAEQVRDECARRLTQLKIQPHPDNLKMRLFATDILHSAAYQIGKIEIK